MRSMSHNVEKVNTVLSNTSNIYCNMPNNEFTRLDHIKFHIGCIIRISRLFLLKKIPLSEYFRKGGFFINGIIRAFLQS